MKKLFFILIVLLLTVFLLGQGASDEVRQANKVARAANGKLVRIVGGPEPAENVAVSTSVLGDVVEVANPGNGLCHVILDARPIAKSIIFDDGMEYVGNVPNIPELKNAFGKASWPVMIPGSCNGVGACMWSALFRGAACLAIAETDYYVGSTMHEFLALPRGQQRRFLRVRGTCTENDLERSCSVPIGDPRANVGSPVTVPHGWSGRIDLNYVKAQNGKPNPRHPKKAKKVEIK